MKEHAKRILQLKKYLTYVDQNKSYGILNLDFSALHLLKIAQNDGKYKIQYTM